MSATWPLASAFGGTLLLCVLWAVLLAGLRRVLVGVGAPADGASVAALALGAVAVADVPAGLLAAIGSDIAVGTIVVVVVAAVAGVVAGRASRAPPARSPVRFGVVDGAVVVAAIVLLSVAALSTFMWDERSTHLPLANALARGVVPLEHPLFPGQPLRYHAGYAVVVAVLRRFTGLPADVAADVVTIAGIVAVVIGARHLLIELALRLEPLRKGPLSMSMVRFTAAVGVVLLFCAGGPLAAILADGWGAALPGKGLLPSTWVNGATFPPLVVTNIFQHPQGLAMPLALVALRTLLLPQRLGRFVVVGVVVVVLARVQVLFCAALGLMMALRWGLLCLRRPRDATVHGFVVAAAAIAAIAGGRVVPGNVEGALVFGAGYFAADGAAAVVHEALAFGLILGCLPMALFWSRRLRAVDADAADVVAIVGVVGTVGVVVGNVAAYARSWDIVKFFGVSMFFGHVVVALALGGLSRRWQLVVVTCFCWSGLFWVIRHGLLQGVVAPMVPEQGVPAWVSSFDARCGRLIAPRTTVWASDLDVGLAGYLSPGVDWRRSRDTAALLIDRDQVDAARGRRSRILANPDAAVAAGDVGDDDVIVIGPSARATPARLPSSRLFQSRCEAAGATLLMRDIPRRGAR